jgi:hypothetical protein
MAHILPFESWILSLDVLNAKACVGLDTGALHLVDLHSLQSAVLRPATGSKCSVSRWDPHTLLVADPDALSLLDIRTGQSTSKPRTAKCPYSTLACQPAASLFAVGTTLVSSDALVEIWLATAGALDKD